MLLGVQTIEFFQSEIVIPHQLLAELLFYRQLLRSAGCDRD